MCYAVYEAKLFMKNNGCLDKHNIESAIGKYKFNKSDRKIMHIMCNS